MKPFVTCMIGVLMAVSTGFASPSEPPEPARESAEPATVQTGGEPSDTTDTFPKKRRAKEGWEVLLSTPGMIAYLPFRVLFWGVTGLIVVNETYDVAENVYDFLTSDDGRVGVFPTFESRAGGGLKFFVNDHINPGSRFTTTASMGIRSRSLLRLHYKRIDLFGGALTSGYRVEYRNMPDEDFFGIGPNTQEADESNYRHQHMIGEITLGHRFTEQLQFDVMGTFEHNIIKAGEDTKSPSTTALFDESTLPGIRDEVPLLGVALGLEYEGRNRPYRPTAGFDINVTGGVYGDVGDEMFGYSAVTADITRYLHLFHERVLALRVAGRFADPFENRAIPFYDLSELGRFETIRGFKRGRFRDRDRLIGSIEYRYPVWRWADFVLFADAGQVAGSIFDDFEWDDVEVTFGGGFNAWHAGGSAGRLEIGFSDDGFRIHFKLN